MQDTGHGGRQATAAPSSLRTRVRCCRWKVSLAALVAGAAIFHTTAIRAEQIIFTADSEILIVRGRQHSSIAIYEVLGSEDGEIRCVAVGASGEPLAVAVSFVEVGAVMFLDLQVKDVSKVVCKYQG